MSRDLMNLWRVVDSKIDIPEELLQVAHPTVREQWLEGLISSVEMMEHVGHRIACSTYPAELC